MSKKLNRHETEAMINARAWKDPAFKKKLLADPKAALREMGMDHLPADLHLHVVKEEKNNWCIVLRDAPAHYERLSDAELQRIAAAGGVRTACESWGC